MRKFAPLTRGTGTRYPVEARLVQLVALSGPVPAPSPELRAIFRQDPPTQTTTSIIYSQTEEVVAGMRSVVIGFAPSLVRVQDVHEMAGEGT
jgi:hypothetical protein